MIATTPRGAWEHEVVLHDGTAHFVDLMVPFVREGAAAGEEVVVMGEPDFVAALLATAPVVPTPRVLAEPEGDRVPARDLHRFRQLLDRLDREVPRVRVVNQMPVMTAARWLEWRRYESAVNVAIEQYPVWGKCGYDARRLDPGMLGDLEASHSSVQTAGGRHPSAAFAHRDARARRYLDVPEHPVASTEPALVRQGVTAAEARRAVRDLADRSALPVTARDCAVLATSEAVLDAHRHGRPPVQLRAWLTGGGSLTVAVSDTGPGPHPLVGMLPPGSDASRTAGGMWVVHLLLPDMHHRVTGEGYTVTFAVDAATALPGTGRAG